MKKKKSSWIYTKHKMSHSLPQINTVELKSINNFIHPVTLLNLSSCYN